MLGLHGHFGLYFVRMQAEEHLNTDMNSLDMPSGKFGCNVLFNLNFFFMSTFVYNFITMYVCDYIVHTSYFSIGWFFCFFPPFSFLSFLFSSLIISFLIWLSYPYLLLHKHSWKISEYPSALFSAVIQCWRNSYLTHTERNTHIEIFFTIYFVKQHQISMCIFILIFQSKVPFSLNPYLYGLFILSFLVFLIHLFIYLFLAMLGLRCCARAFSSCNERGLLFVAVHKLLTVVASLVVEHRL